MDADDRCDRVMDELEETLNSKPPRFDQWGAVDVMGHQRYYGRITEQVVAGSGFVRVDVPGSEGRPGFSKLIGTGSIYAISPMDEFIVRRLAAEHGATPIESYNLTGPVVERENVERLAEDEPW